MKTLENRESRLYLDFLKQNLIILAVPILFGAGLGLVYSQNLYSLYHSSLLLEMDYTETSLRDRGLLTDQATAILRSAQIQDQLNLTKNNKLTIYKSGPVAISVESQGPDPIETHADLDGIKAYATQSYPLHSVGEIITSIKPKKIWLLVLIGGTIGGVIGLTWALIKTYLKHF